MVHIWRRRLTVLVHREKEVPVRGLMHSSATESGNRVWQHGIGGVLHTGYTTFPGRESLVISEGREGNPL